MGRPPRRGRRSDDRDRRQLCAGLQAERDRPAGADPARSRTRFRADRRRHLPRRDDARSDFLGAPDAGLCRLSQPASRDFTSAAPAPIPAAASPARRATTRRERFWPITAPCLQAVDKGVDKLWITCGRLRSFGNDCSNLTNRNGAVGEQGHDQKSALPTRGFWKSPPQKTIYPRDGSRGSGSTISQMLSRRLPEKAGASRLLERARDRRELVVQAGAQAVHDRNDRKRDARRDQTVFDRGCPRTRRKETSE